jgi:DNA-binding MarR family transcriptional regulator
MAMQDIHNAMQYLGLPSKSHKLALIQIAIWVKNGSGLADVVNSELAKAAEVSERQVKRIKKQLQEMGLVYVINGVGRRNWTRYLFLLGRKAHEIYELLKKNLQISGAELLALCRKLVKAQRGHIKKVTSGKGDISTRKKVTSGTQKVTSGTQKGDAIVSPDSDDSDSIDSEKDSEEKEKAPSPAPEIWSEELQGFLEWYVQEKSWESSLAKELVLKDTDSGKALADFSVDQIKRWGAWFDSRLDKTGDRLNKPSYPETIRRSILAWWKAGEPGPIERRDGNNNGGYRGNSHIENDRSYDIEETPKKHVEFDPAEFRRKAQEHIDATSRASSS